MLYRFIKKSNIHIFSTDSIYWISAQKYCFFLDMQENSTNFLLKVESLGFRDEKIAPFLYRRCRNGGLPGGHWSSLHAPRQ